MFPGSEVNQLGVLLDIGCFPPIDASEAKLEKNEHHKDRPHEVVTGSEELSDPIAPEEGPPGHDEEAADRSDHRRFSIGALLENADHDDGEQRDEVDAIELLEVAENTVSTHEDQGGADRSEHRYRDTAPPTGSNDLFGRCGWIDRLLVDAEGEQCGTGVQDRIVGGEDRSNNHCCEESGESRGQNCQNQGAINAGIVPLTRTVEEEFIELGILVGDVETEQD